MRLGDRMVERENRRFVGRSAELETLRKLFDDEPAHSIVYLHGPGGIGKSTLLRQAVLTGEAKGWSAHWIEGRDLPPTPEALADALAPALIEERPLVLLDTFERMSAMAGHLRDELLPALPGRAAVIIAGRTPPDPGWFSGGWETVTAELTIAPLGEEE